MTNIIIKFIITASVLSSGLLLQQPLSSAVEDDAAGRHKAMDEAVKMLISRREQAMDEAIYKIARDYKPGIEKERFFFIRKPA